MDIRELNDRVQALGKKFISFRSNLNISDSEFDLERIEKEIKVEYQTLYRENNGLDLFTKENLLILIKINQSLSVLPTFRFGMHVNLKNVA